MCKSQTPNVSATAKIGSPPAATSGDGEVADFASTFGWIAGAVGIVILIFGGLAAYFVSCYVSLLTLAATCTVVTVATIAVALMYAQQAWKPPAKRSRSCGRQRFSAEDAEKKGPWDVIIVGSGSGGLTCASVLSQLNYKVLVLEAHELAGGSTHEYNVDGKTNWAFPSGLHYTIPASEQMLQVACGAAVPPVRFPKMGDDTDLGDSAYDRVRLGRLDKAGLSDELRVISDVQLRAELRERFPGLEPQLAKFEKLSMQLLQAFPIWCALHALPMGARRVACKALLPAVWWQYASKNSEEVLMELFADAPASEAENVRQLHAYICGLWLDAGCAPQDVSFFMIAAVALGFPHEGGAYPEGGTKQLGMTLVESIESRGGACYVRAPVQQVLLNESGRAIGVELSELAGGAKLYAKTAVVSACGWRNTAKLCPRMQSSQQGFHEREKLQLRQGDGFVMLNVGIKGDAAEIGLPCCNLELQPAGDGMSVFDGVRAYLEDPLGVPITEIPAMLTFPTVKDRAYHKKAVPEGKSQYETAQVLCLAKTSWFAATEEEEEEMDSEKNVLSINRTHTPAWKVPTRNKNYAEMKEKWRERLVNLLLHHYPKLEGKIELADLSTPLTIEHYLPTGSGTAIGLDTNAGKGCRFTDMETMALLDMRTVVDGLWLTGQDALMCGVPLAQAAGLITAIRIAGPIHATCFVLKAATLLAASFLGITKA